MGWSGGSRGCGAFPPSSWGSTSSSQQQEGIRDRFPIKKPFFSFFVLIFDTKFQVHIHTHKLGARERIEGAATRILSTTHRKRKRLLQKRIDPDKIEFAHLFLQHPEQRNRESESIDNDHFSIGESVDHIQNISSRILVKAGDRRLVLLRRQRLDILPRQRNPEEINEFRGSDPDPLSHNPELKIVNGSFGEKELTGGGGGTLGNQPDREIQV